MARVWTNHPHSARPERTDRLLPKFGRSVRLFIVKTYPTEEDFRREFKDRLRRIRDKMPGKPSQAKMAALLGIETSTYAKYEQQSAPDNNFPMYLLPRLCDISGHDPWYVLTEEAPAQSPGRRKAS